MVVIFWIYQITTQIFLYTYDASRNKSLHFYMFLRSCKYVWDGCNEYCALLDYRCSLKASLFVLSGFQSYNFRCKCDRSFEYALDRYKNFFFILMIRCLYIKVVHLCCWNSMLSFLRIFVIFWICLILFQKIFYSSHILSFYQNNLSQDHAYLILTFLNFLSLII